MIETIEGLPDGVIGFEAAGEVSADDYRDVLVPAIEAALRGGERLSLLYVLGERFDGMSAGAMWQDTKLGLEHPRSWQRLAIVTDVEWIGHAIKAFAWTIPAEVRVFALADRGEAEAWLGGT